MICLLTGFASVANPLTSALSQMTLIVRGMPRDRSKTVATASRVNVCVALPPACESVRDMRRRLANVRRQSRT
jgi:hypothetical protein